MYHEFSQKKNCAEQKGGKCILNCNIYGAPLENTILRKKIYSFSIEWKCEEKYCGFIFIVKTFKFLFSFFTVFSFLFYFVVTLSLTFVIKCVFFIAIFACLLTPLVYWTNIIFTQQKKWEKLEKVKRNLEENCIMN